MNAVHIIGNLTADPEIKTANTSGGEATVCNFTVAVNRRAGGRDYVDFFRVTLWNRWADAVGKYLHKGSKVAVTGSVTSRAWTGSDGSAHAGLEIVQAQHLELLDRKPAAPENRPSAAAPSQGFAEVTDDELPF